MTFIFKISINVYFTHILKDPHYKSKAPLSMGFPRQEYWSGLPFPTPENIF